MSLPPLTVFLLGADYTLELDAKIKQNGENYVRLQKSFVGAMALGVQSAAIQGRYHSYSTAIGRIDRHR
jgi:hypothetical protein